jgi:hypothetical protein
MKQLITLFFSAMMLLGTSSCHRDKISCPTYAYSFPFPNEKPKKKKLSALSPNKMGKNTLKGKSQPWSTANQYLRLLLSKYLSTWGD